MAFILGVMVSLDYFIKNRSFGGALLTPCFPSLRSTFLQVVKVDDTVDGRNPAPVDR